jgi:hypothetical protein
MLRGTDVKAPPASDPGSFVITITASRQTLLVLITYTVYYLLVNYYPSGIVTRTTSPTVVSPSRSLLSPL